MKFDAHPLLVAVALGLLGPTALDLEDDEEAFPTVAASSDDGVEELLAADAPDDAEFHRVELEWLAATRSA